MPERGVSLRWILALLSAVLLAVSAPSPDLSGTWQGVMDTPSGRLPRVMRIVKSGSTYAVTIYSPKESDVPLVTHNVSVDGANITMTFDMNSDPWMDYHRVYHAKLSADGKVISGSWNIPGFKNLTMAYHRTPPVTLHLRVPKRDVYVTVAPGVKDEVLDWGGTGRAMLIVPGQGVTARYMQPIVPDLVKHYHLYVMTRRGYGNSSKPAPTVANYSAERLGKDVLAILDTLHIEKPILVGHSLGGEELSYIGTYDPQRVAGLVYLDAAYGYAYDAGIKMPPDPSPPPGTPTDAPVDVTIDSHPGHFTRAINVPILAIFANPHTGMDGIPKKFVDAFNTYTSEQIAAFKKGNPRAKVIVIPNADHFVYVSNKAQVLSDIYAFTATLGKEAP
jgi:non-heme chloroperoxidase